MHRAALGLLSGLLSVACGGKAIISDADGGSSSAGANTAGGAVSSGGAGAGTAGGVAGAAPSCSTPPGCGGNLVGTWSVVSSCLVVSGQLDVGILGLGCPSAAVAGSRQVTGTWTANADWTYVDRTTTSGVDQIQLAAACQRVSGTHVACDHLGPIFTAFGYNSAVCEDAPAGGCACSAKAELSGGVRAVSLGAGINGTFSTSGDVVTLDNLLSYSYCEMRSMLTLTPKPMNPTITGSIRFERTAR